MMISEKQAIKKESLKQKLATIPNTEWKEVFFEQGREKKPFVLTQQYFKVKGITSPLLVECRFVEVENHYLVIQAYSVLNKPQGLGAKRQENLKQLIEAFLASSDLVYPSNHEVSYAFYHALTEEEIPLHGSEDYYWNSNLEHQRAFYRIASFGIEDYYPLVHLKYYPRFSSSHIARNQEVIYYSNALYTNVDGHEELFWVEDQLQVKNYFSKEEDAFRVIPHPRGEYLHFSETHQVFKKMYDYHLDQPLRLFPKKMEELCYGLPRSLSDYPLTWIEFTKNNDISPEVNHLTKGKDQRIELAVLAQRLKEDIIKPLNKGDYVCINPNTSDSKAFGWIAEVLDDKTGEYLITPEENNCYTTEKTYRHSEIEWAEFPPQLYVGQFVYVKKEGFGVLKQEGYRQSQVEMWKRTYDYSTDQSTLSSSVVGQENENLLLISNQALSCEWESFLKIEELQETLNKFFSTNPQWFFVQKWMTHCEFDFTTRHMISEELSFIFILLFLMKQGGTEHLVFDLILNASVPAYSNRGESLLFNHKKIDKFLEYFTESSEWASQFLAYSTEN